MFCNLGADSDSKCMQYKENAQNYLGMAGGRGEGTAAGGGGAEVSESIESLNDL
jgi:hypothetical protein